VNRWRVNCGRSVSSSSAEALAGGDAAVAVAIDDRRIAAATLNARASPRL
jgi:hypothetical protein